MYMSVCVSVCVFAYMYIYTNYFSIPLHNCLQAPTSTYLSM